MKRLLIGLIAFLLILQSGLFLYGCAGNPSKSASTQMASTAKLSIVVKDAATGAKLPMTGVFSNKTAATATAANKHAVHSLASGDWDQTQTNNMGYAEVPDLKTDNSVMVKIDNSANSYESYSKVVNVGKNITGLTVYITTNESATPSYDVAFDPTAPTSAPSGTTLTNT